jgi:hypothetical protein
MTKKVSSKEIRIEITRFTFLRTRKFTTGCSTMAIITAKTIGIIIPLAIYKIDKMAIKPTKKILALI